MTTVGIADLKGKVRRTYNISALPVELRLKTKNV